jgi:predicted dehydrogenase
VLEIKPGPYLPNEFAEWDYGRTVLIPAFRQDPRCEIVALAGTDTARTAELARAANVARGLGSWQAISKSRPLR